MAEVIIKGEIKKADLMPRIRAAMKEVAILGESRAREIAPVDTGEFRRSIGHVQLSDTAVAIGSSDVPGKVWALEHGHSKQAPTGVFREMLRRYENQLLKTFKLGFRKG